jgi:hypothetical protein
VVACSLGCLVGCFDVQEVPVDPAASEARPSALLIDDFEDGDARPSSSAFGAWRCQTLDPGPGIQPVACGPASEGSSSDHGYSLWFELSDTPDGVEAFPVASLWSPTVVPLDISRYERLHFSARYEPGNVPLPDAAFLQVSLGCQGPTDGFSLDNVVLLPLNWQSSALPLADFAQPEWQTARIEAARCSAQISELSFEVKGFADGQAATGTLLVDNVYLQ